MKSKFKKNIKRHWKKISVVVVFCVLIFSAGETYDIVKKPVQVDSHNEKLVNDVTQLNPVQVSKVYIPKTNEEVANIVKTTKGKISIGGGRNSMGGQIGTQDGVQIDMREFNKILYLSTTTKEITAQAGARWYQIQEYIDPYNLSVMVMQSYNNFSVGGSLSTNVHGRYIGYGPMISSIKSFRIILANGELVEASREKNSDIFYGAIGGYGAFGVVTDVTLKLADNTNLERQVQRVSITDYVNYFKQNVENNEDVIFQNADIYVNNYTDANSVIWKISDKDPTEKEHLISKEIDYPINRFSWFAMSEFPFGNELRQYFFDPLLNRKESVHSRNYEASYDYSELEPSSRKDSTYVLQEYFIPIERFDEFVPKMKKVFQDNHVNVLNISIRHAKKDEGSILAWAKTDVFAFVIYYKQGTSVEDKLHVADWTRQMIDEISAVGGAYYLPYQEHATYEQFKKIYPNYQKFFELKQKYDPNYRYSNTLWDKYYEEYLYEQRNSDYHISKENSEKVAKEFPYYTKRPLEQTYLTIPEWYMVYSYKELASHLREANPQHSFSYLNALKTFWKYTMLATSQGQKFNLGYFTMDLIIGSSFSVEYGIKFIYENTFGRVTGLIDGYNTDEDKYIATSWSNFSNNLDKDPWYEYRYWQDLKGIWTENSFLKGTFIRSTERKISFTVAYAIKAVYAKILKFASESSFGAVENQTLFVVSDFHIEDYPIDLQEKIKVLKQLYAEGAIYLLQTPRYQEFSDIAVELAKRNVDFLQIMNNDTIALSYISDRKSESFEYFEGASIVSKEKLSSDQSKQRIILRVDVTKLNRVINVLLKQNIVPEHIYDY